MARISLKLFLKDKFILIPLLANFLSVLGLFFYLLFSFQKVGEKTIFLHYTVHLGVDLIGSRFQIHFLSFGAFLVVILNSVLAYFIYLNQKYLSRALVLSTLFIQIFLWAAGAFLVFINL